MAYQYDYSQQPHYAAYDTTKTTLWMGELEPWMDENYIRQLWYSLGEQVNVKMIRDKFTGSGYCFIDFISPQSAQKALASVNGTLIPNTHKLFKLNWASGGGLNDRRDDRGPEFSIFVGDLGPEVTEFMLVSTFQSRYMSCKSAKIMTDPNTGMSRGYGFVRFSDESEQLRALSEMQGIPCGNRPMRISMATPKNKASGAGAMTGGFYNQAPQQQQPMLNQFNDPNNTTVFVGGLSGVTHEDELRQYFAPFGEITYVKIPPGKGCGFVQFVHRQSAEMAINQMNGYQIGNSRVRLSWGRSQNDKTQGGMMAPGPFRSPQPGLPYSPLNPASPYPAYPAAHHNYTAPSNMAPVVAMHHVAPVIVDPLEPIPVERMNEAYMNGKEGLLERMETEGSSWRANGIYAQ